MKNSFRIASILGLSVLTILANAQTNPATVQKLVDEGKNHNNVMFFMNSIAKDIGPRLTGSNKLARGQQWAMEQFKKMGCTNVHLDKWGEVPVGFERGVHQSCKMVEPYDVDMAFTTTDWTNGTNGKVKADAILAPMTGQDVIDHASDFKGKWVVLPMMPRPTGGPGGPPPAGGPPPNPQADVVAELSKLPIAGIISGSRTDLVLTSGSWNLPNPPGTPRDTPATPKSYDNHPGPVRVSIGKSDYDRIIRNFDFKRKVVLEIEAENKWIKGPVPQYNVVADIKGSEKPDEIVIIGGHFDSWDGPGSQGASDNGTGSAVTLEAARLLTSAGAKPKRTIRFILWSGEEQGLYGSVNYVKNHPDELDKISAVLIDDGGSNYQGGFVVLQTMKQMFDDAIAPMVAAFPDYPQTIRVVDTMPRGGGSDHASFNAVGVPGFFTIETGKQDYNFVHHTQYDNLNYVIPEYLVQSSTNFAVVSYSLACAPTMLPRGPKPAQAPAR